MPTVKYVIYQKNSKKVLKKIKSSAKKGNAYEQFNDERLTKGLVGNNWDRAEVIDKVCDDDDLDTVCNDKIFYEPEVKQSEPTIQFDKKVLESGLSFKEAYMRMVEGKKISRPCFMGWWFMNHESKVVIHDRYGNELKEGDITNTVTNTLGNDWEVIE